MHGFIVAIGASSGGVRALTQLVKSLPRDFPAPVLVVQHIGAHRSTLPLILSYHGSLPARHVIDGELMVPGVIYVAPPDHHMLVEGDRLRLTRGPKEHYTRPSIDPLFRTAALQHGPRVIGVLLTGRLDDGTAGLQAIKRCGGTAVVQDPTDAEEPEMPQSALRYVDVDHCVSLAELPSLLAQLVQLPEPSLELEGADMSHESDAAQGLRRQDIESEEALSEGAVDAVAVLQTFAKPTTFTCPDCHGTLWEIDASRPVRYRCHTGHAYTLKSLALAQAEAVDSALWTAIRALQEQALFCEREATAATAEHDQQAADQRLKEAERLKAQVLALRDLVGSDP